MKRYRTYGIAIASISLGLLAAAPARAASVTMVPRATWGATGVPSYMQMYIYVPDTGTGGQGDLVRQFVGQMGKAALIIDERWNGGGQIPTRFIEMLNRAIANGKLTDSKYHRIHVERIPMDRELGYRSKMDRSPALLEELREFGKTKCRWFLKQRESEVAGRVDARRDRPAEPARPS